MRIGGIVVLYEPSWQDIEHIRGYIRLVDNMVILDNSTVSVQSEIQEVLVEEEYLYQHFPDNIGLCTALNIGMKMVFEAGCQWTLLMDDDSQLITDVVAVYKEEIERYRENNVAIYAPVHIFDRSKEHDYEGTKNLIWAMTSGCFYNNEIFNTLGGFKEALFVDSLDMDYCHLATENGYKVVECGKAQIKHHPAETYVIKLFGKEIIKYGKASPWRYYMQARGLIWVYLRYRYWKDLLFYLWKWVKILFFFDNKSEYFIQVKKGTKDGISLWKEYKRKQRDA